MLVIAEATDVKRVREKRSLEFDRRIAQLLSSEFKLSTLNWRTLSTLNYDKLPNATRRRKRGDDCGEDGDDDVNHSLDGSFR